MECLNWINWKLGGLNWTKVKLKDWNEFQSNLESVICILAYFLRDSLFCTFKRELMWNLVNNHIDDFQFFLRNVKFQFW